MVKKKAGSIKKQVAESPDGGDNRESKIMNTVINTSIILMSTLMGGFSELMVGMTGAFVSGMAEAVGGQEAGDKVRSEVNQKLPEVTDEMKNMISEMRKDIYLQMEKKRMEMKPFLSDKIFDKGPLLVESYDFGIPKLTLQLDDAALAQYTYLLISEDGTFAKLFGELTDWMKSLPSLQSKNEDEE